MSGERRRRAAAVAVAVVAAVAGFLLAPRSWPGGDGTMSLRIDGTEAIAAPVRVGDPDPVRLEGPEAGVSVELALPAGVPVEGVVAAQVAATGASGPVRLEPGDIELELMLPDGRVEPIPALRWDAGEGVLVAERRPPQDAALVLALLGFVVVMWVTEAVPVFVTALAIPVVLTVAGVAGAADATAPFANPIIVLFFAGFLMAEAMRRVGLDHHVAVAITARAGHSPALLFATMLAVAAFLSMWMSNTAATAVLVPIAMAISAPLGTPYQRALVLGIAYAATAGGVGSAIGTPANQLAIEFLDDFGGRSISFAGWFAYGLPMVLLFLPVVGGYLWWRRGLRVDPVRFQRARELAVAERTRLGPPHRGQLAVLAVFGAVFCGWLTETWHGVHPGLVALAGAVALFVVGKLEPDDLGRIAWPALLTFGGGLTLGLFLVRSGTSDYVATRLGGLAGAPPTMALFAVAALALLLTTVASNTASAAILVPLAVPLAGVLGVDPTTLVVVVAIASSIDFALVVGTPPTMIAYSTRLYTAGEIFRTGVVLDLAGIAVLVLAVTRLWP